ncbi:hypothetical protein Pmar_PMAR003554 [Perkinsus marinus ATCC 50983]|uniref:Uncharacterized protein n=1 Tax=Perkinsus marinus (strain ATCC 50983 / TXsc) TaxID=423536 RepID=C5KHM9_PERM5|nr:hypothetical protein Pmar_PMAR003554 [Perkinsus marinus ATCC 50983]EER16091.1 hypothetical protein Pmar_PMAR003554 [Perkinsus marinus ATCC 50983]|eukprot:XP_002784295.1 hypothetical protein Pmar_PMAR003554 [Perkinsus marinus ATCC 50983]
MGMGPPIPVGMPSGRLEGEAGAPRREGKIHHRETKVHRARSRVLNERNISQPRPKAAPGLSVDRKSSNALLVGEDLAKAELRDGLGSKVLVRAHKNDTVKDRVGSSVAILNPYGTQDIQI